jgi:hypothetical protein
MAAGYATKDRFFENDETQYRMVCVIEVVDNPKFIQNARGKGKEGILVIGDDNGCLLRFLLLVKAGFNG